MAKKAPDKNRARLRALIEEATVDCYNEDEQHVGLMTMVEDNVVCPFKAKVIGEEVEVVELRSRDAGFGVDAVCRYKGKEYKIDINSLEWPKKKPEGFEWVEAYQAWRADLPPFCVPGAMRVGLTVTVVSSGRRRLCGVGLRTPLPELRRR